MTDVSSRGPAGDERQVLTNRQGHQVYDNQNQRTVGARGPATLENYQFLEKISHFDRERIPERVVHARGVTGYGFFEATESGATSRSAATPGRSCSRSRASVRSGRAVLHRDRRAGLLRGRARPARVRGEVLHRGRQLGPGRQQPGGLLHPGRHQVPRRDPRAQAGPGDVPAGAQPDLRLHVADAREHAHARQPVQPTRNPRRLPAHAGLRRQHLQVGQRQGRHTW